MIKNFIFCAAPLPPSLVTSGNEEGEEEKAKSHQSQRHREKQCSAMVRSRQWRPNQAAAPAAAEVSARRGEESGGVSAQRTQSQSHSPAPFSPTTSRVRQKRQEREKEKEKEKDFELT
jgi:hypothetical protein